MLVLGCVRLRFMIYVDDAGFGLHMSQIYRAMEIYGNDAGFGLHTSRFTGQWRGLGGFFFNQSWSHTISSNIMKSFHVQGSRYTGTCSFLVGYLIYTLEAGRDAWNRRRKVLWSISWVSTTCVWREGWPMDSCSLEFDGWSWCEHSLYVTGGQSLNKFHEKLCRSCKPLRQSYWILIFSCIHYLLALLPNLSSLAGVSMAAALTSLWYAFCNFINRSLLVSISVDCNRK